MSRSFKKDDTVILLNDIVDEDTGDVLVEAGTEGQVKSVDLHRKRLAVYFVKTQKEANALLSASELKSWMKIETDEIRLAKGTFYVDMDEVEIHTRLGRKIDGKDV